MAEGLPATQLQFYWAIHSCSTGIEGVHRAMLVMQRCQEHLDDDFTVYNYLLCHAVLTTVPVLASSYGSVCSPNRLLHQ